MDLHFCNLRMIIGLLLLLVSPFAAHCQITASDSSGCAPLVDVAFTAPNGATNIVWDFGDGTGSGLATPVHTYANVGTYTVLMNALVNGNPVSDTLQIEAYGKPNAAFTAIGPTFGCKPLVVDFADASTGWNGVPITGWEWSFGDGGTESNTPTPIYSFGLPGIFSVSLLITDANGCDTTIVMPDLISTSNLPTLVSTTTPNPPITCLGQIDVTFSATGSQSNAAAGPGLTYFWDLGNGQTATVENPGTYSYAGDSVYKASLAITDINGCTNSDTIAVSVGAPVADFTLLNHFNDTICGLAEFENNSTPGDYMIDYGDGFSDTLLTHNYPIPGDFTARLIVTAGSCSDTDFVHIVTEEVIAAFTSDTGYTCNDTLVVQRTNQSINSVAWEWSGLGGISNLEHPLQNVVDYFSPPNEFVPYPYVEDSTYLVAISAYGCRDTVAHADTIHRPWAGFTLSKIEGCAPLNVTFSNLSSTSWGWETLEWHFGDGNITGGDTATIPHVYNTPGVYTAHLVVTDSLGCSDTSHPMTIRVGAPPSPDLTVVPMVVCPNIPVQISDASSPADSIDTWHYEGDGGSLSHCGHESSPFWSFSAQAGPQDISVTAMYNGCATDTTITNALTLLGPIGRFTHQCNCAVPSNVSFIANTSAVDSVVWDFGDGITLGTTTDMAPIHTYANTGDYLVTLTSFNYSSGCVPFVDSANVHVRKVAAEIIGDTIGCADTLSNFSGINSVDVHGDYGEGFLWDVANVMDPTAFGPARHYASVATGIHIDSAGTFLVRLRATDINGCVDTAFHTINLFAVDAAISVDTLMGCVPFTPNFSDASTADTSLIGWAWTFSGTGPINGQNASFTFTNTDSSQFTAILKAVDVLGCSDTDTVLLIASRPSDAFHATSTTNICAGDSIGFAADSITDHYFWDFGDGHTDTVQAPTHTFDSAGWFDISLTVTDSNGCSVTKVVPQWGKVQAKPNAIISTSTDSTDQLCYPLLLTITDSTVNNSAATRTWDLGTGNPLVGYVTVGWLFDAPGDYTVTLINTTSFGCRDTATRVLNIEGPVANFVMSDSLICKGEAITFNIADTADVDTWAWDFGDGFDTTAIDSVNHTYNYHPPLGQTLATLVYWSEDSSCVQALTKPVNIIRVVADFAVANSDTAHCLGISNSYIDQSTNAFSHAWNLGNGTTFDGPNPPPVEYTEAGTFHVSLAIGDDQTGCVDTLVREIIVYPVPDALATGGTGCEGDSIPMQVTGGANYQWSPPTGLSSQTAANPATEPDSTTLYIVQVTDSNNCTAFDSAVAIVVHPLPSIQFDTTIIIGQQVLVQSPSGNALTYTWSPSDGLLCDTCQATLAQPEVNTDYILTLEDSAGCFTVESDFTFEVLPLASVDVPTGFTPGVDGPNAQVFARGWGIKELVYFRIYNRWGELVFETTDLNQGWDGTYKGKPQNMDSYGWTVEAIPWIGGDNIIKKGTITLLR